MARPIVITWPLTDNAAVAQPQTTAAAGALVLNGTLVAPTNFPPFASFPNIYRVVTLTSLGNLSGINFTITGMGVNGVTSQTIAGPNSNTVATTTLFTTVTSVTASAAVGTAVEVGTGTTGTTDWLKYNYNATVMGVTVGVKVAGTINYTLQATLDEILTNSSPLLFNPNFVMVAATASLVAEFGLYSVPYTGAGAPTYSAPVYVPTAVNYYQIAINSSDATGSIVFTSIQQGIL